MMRRLRLSQQLVTLYFSILVVSFGLVAILIFSRLQIVYKQEALDRLDSYVESTKDMWSKGEPITLQIQDFELGFLQGNVFVPGKGIIYSENIDKFIDNQKLNEILGGVRPGDSKSDICKANNGSVVFYSYGVELDGDFSIFFTNSSYVNKMKKNISFEVVIIFLCVLIFSSIVISLWTKGFVNRIHKIQQHVQGLPKNNYEISYDDGGFDEISDLAESIETMREEIYKNENTKQEMLQNISHDFKTPIAVIKSYAEAMGDGMAGEEAGEIIIAQADLLKKKVTKLLQLNRLEYLQKTQEFQDINIKEIIQNVVNTYKYQTDVKIEVDIQDVYYKGYAENYYTVIDNLLDNAKRYAKSVIKIKLDQNKLVIYNDGEHIDEQFLNGLFKPYEKGSNGQFGLGMSIVKKTLDFFDMKISVKNEDVGVSFIITKK